MLQNPKVCTSQPLPAPQPLALHPHGTTSASGWRRSEVWAGSNFFWGDAHAGRIPAGDLELKTGAVGWSPGCWPPKNWGQLPAEPPALAVWKEAVLAGCLHEQSAQPGAGEIKIVRAAPQPAAWSRGSSSPGWFPMETPPPSLPAPAWGSFGCSLAHGCSRSQQGRS